MRLTTHYWRNPLKNCTHSTRRPWRLFGTKLYWFTSTGLLDRKASLYLRLWFYFPWGASIVEVKLPPSH